MASKLTDVTRPIVSQQVANILPIAVEQITAPASSGVERMNAASALAALLVAGFVDEIVTDDVAAGIESTLQQAAQVVTKRRQVLRRQLREEAAG